MVDGEKINNSEAHNVGERRCCHMCGERAFIYKFENFANFIYWGRLKWTQVLQPPPPSSLFRYHRGVRETRWK